MNSNRHRVVITGMGIISVLGNSVDQLWDNLLAGKSGINKISQFDASDLPCQIAGEIRDFDPGVFISKKEARRMPRSSQMGLASAIGAVKSSGLPNSMEQPERAAVVYGTALGGIDFIDHSILTLRQKGFKQLSPFHAGGSIPNLPAFLISREFQCLGPNSTLVTACATGTQVIGDGTELIRRGAADIAIVGGTEAFITDYGVGAFAAMRALPKNFNHEPQRASRPFDKTREGFVLSEGAATLVLENLDHAKTRQAPILAEVIGHASSADGYHVSAPSPDASGPIRAMKWALEDGGITPEEVNYINAHGTSTPLNDKMETVAIKKLFNEHAYNLSISSTKSMMGHAMGASGAMEAIISVKALNHNKIPPTINYEIPDPDLDLDYTPNQAKDREINITLSNSFGLGGQNACLVLRTYMD